MSPRGRSEPPPAVQRVRRWILVLLLLPALISLGFHYAFSVRGEVAATVYAMGFFAAWAAYFRLEQRLYDRAAAAGYMLCPRCLYPLADVLGDVCPECGDRFTAADLREKWSESTRRGIHDQQTKEEVVVIDDPPRDMAPPPKSL